MSKDEIIAQLNDITADLVAEIDQLKRERYEARDFAQSVYRWGPRAQWAIWEELHPWLKEAPGSE